MIIANGNVISIAAAAPDWVAVLSEGNSEDITCPVIGWATVVQAHMNDGTVTTSVEPAFLWGEQVWTETDAREHSTGGLRFEIRAREITQPVTKVTIVDSDEAEAHIPEVRVFHRADGWSMGEENPEPCTSNFHRQQDGRPACTATAVWKVVEDCGMHLSVGFYCDGDLPAEHQRLVARV
ncbi:hypothetical protein [Streptomyces sp. MK5]|uniref:hypothetical protein n=1 Tax=Streptomyces sp. MK5 TaxID=3064253 RepID=UPI0027403718|nr:hypothetical protein [Streptomyces sp. MK5]